MGLPYPNTRKKPLRRASCKSKKEMFRVGQDTHFLTLIVHDQYIFTANKQTSMNMKSKWDLRKINVISPLRLRFCWLVRDMGIPGGCRDACGCRWPGGPMLCVPIFIIPGLPPIIIGPLPLITAPLLVMALFPGSGDVPRRMSRLPSPFPRPPNNKPWDILSHKCTTDI